MTDSIAFITKKLEHDVHSNALSQAMFGADGALIPKSDRNQMLQGILVQNQLDSTDYQRRLATGRTTPDETPVVPLELTMGDNVVLKSKTGETLYSDTKDYRQQTETVRVGDAEVKGPLAPIRLTCTPSKQYKGMDECH